MGWTVKRHGGNSNHTWKTVYSGDEAKAREVYQARYLDLRQGSLVLCCGETVIKKTDAGRNRTRW